MKNKDFEQCKKNINVDNSLKEKTWDAIENYNKETIKFPWKKIYGTAAGILFIVIAVVLVIVLGKNEDYPIISYPPGTTQPTMRPTISNTTTKSSATTTKPPAAETESPAVTTPPPSQDGYVKLSANELADIKAMMEEGENWIFLTCIYNEPKEIDLYEVLYDGMLFYKGEHTKEEVEELVRIYGDDAIYHSSDIIYTKDINDLLFKKTGLHIEDINKGMPRQYRYSEKLDAYLHMHGDTNAIQFECTGGEKSKDGETYIIKYTVYDIENVVNFKIVNGEIMFLSNNIEPERILNKDELDAFEESLNKEKDKDDISYLYAHYEYFDEYKDDPEVKENFTKLKHDKIIVISGFVNENEYGNEYTIYYYANEDKSEIYRISFCVFNDTDRPAFYWSNESNKRR